MTDEPELRCQLCGETIGPDGPDGPDVLFGVDDDAVVHRRCYDERRERGVTRATGPFHRRCSECHDLIRPGDGVIMVARPSVLHARCFLARRGLARRGGAAPVC